MKNIPIKKFGSKMMVATQSVNNIPDEYLKLAQNCRVVDGGIGPAKGKVLIKTSTLGTNTKGAFLMNNIIYQITNSKIYAIDEIAGTQTEIATLGYDARTDILVYGNNIAIIVSEGQALKVFDGATVSTPATVPAGDTGGIIEYTRGFSFYAINNILYISRPITAASPGNAYDFTGTGSENISFNSKITGLKGTMNGLYIFTENTVEYIGANSLQNVAGSATFISQPLGQGGEPMNNLCITASGDKIFYITKNKEVRTINYIGGTSDPTIGELSARPVIGITELLDNIASTQNTAFAFENQNDNTIQFAIKTTNAGFNDIVLVYDLINDTWAIDKGKNYNYVVKKGASYFGFSDINSSIYQDDIGNSLAGSPIPFKIITQELNQGTILQKRYGGFFTAGAIGALTELIYIVRIDGGGVFQDIISGSTENINAIGEIGGAPIGGEPIGGGLSLQIDRKPFDRVADEGRIYQDGKRIQIEVRSQSQTQDFIIDMLGIRAEVTGYSDISDKF